MERPRSPPQAIADLLLLHPLVGTPTDDPTTRRMATPPYPYLIFYEATDDELIIMPSATLRVTRRPCRSDE